MRGKILDQLRQRMREDSRLFFLTGDMGINLVEVFEEEFPDRFLNVGIAEQDLIGVSSGLCNLGFLPVAYTISNFLVHRCYEQVRNDLALHHYPAILLGASAGFDNATLGPTHHIIDEWGALKSFPGIDVYAPASVEFASEVLDLAIARKRPCYIRVAKGGPSIPGTEGIVNYLPAKKAGGPLLVSYGTLASECVKAQAERDDVAVLVMNRIHPVEPADVLAHLKAHDRIMVVEDHFGPTGLYGSLCQLAMERGLKSFIESAAPTDYDLVVGQSSGVYHQRNSLDSTGLLRRLSTPKAA
jgi:transketolase